MIPPLSPSLNSAIQQQDLIIDNQSLTMLKSNYSFARTWFLSDSIPINSNDLQNNLNSVVTTSIETITSPQNKIKKGKSRKNKFDQVILKIKLMKINK